MSSRTRVRTYAAMTALPLAFSLSVCGGPKGSPVDTEDPGNGSGDPPPASSSCPPLPLGAAFAASGTPGSNPAATGTPRIILMGGSSEVDAASRLFVEAAGGGDVLVMRASGSVTSYNDYFRGEVGGHPSPASVGTIRIDKIPVASSPGVLCRVARAQALWLAGGNQWDYLGTWPQSLQDSIVSVGRRGGMGGTSAGAAVMGEMAFDARGGSITSAEALLDPFGPRVQVSPSPLGQPELKGYLVDQHFRQRDREGRLLVFLARMQGALGSDTVFGIGLDERAALVIEGNRFQILAHTGREVSIYRTTKGANALPGVPLDLEGVERVRLEHGASGSWPLDFQGHARDVLHVEKGVVRRTSPSTPEASSAPHFPSEEGLTESNRTPPAVPRSIPTHSP
jgi:cyanophycinase